MTPAEELTAAADRLDALLAEAVKRGRPPWRRDEFHRGLVWDADGLQVADAVDGADHYIAAMNPDVGRALVALLRSCAAYHGARGTRSWLGTDYGLEQLTRAILATKEDA